MFSNITINASDNDGNGITCWTGSHHNTFEDIKIYNAWCGPSLDTYGAGSGSWNNKFKRCLFKGVSVGIFFGETGSDNNTFENCVIDDVNAVYGVGTGSTCLGNEIKNSIIINAKEYKEDGWTGTGTLASSYTCHNDSSNGYTMPTGTGNINPDPLFIDNYHLSQNSKCIDAGDPTDDYSREPEDNGDRINMGIYGNTNLASKSTLTRI